MNTRAHIAAIAPTLDEARALARRLNIPAHNAVSARSIPRGRTFAGYILAPGHIPSPEFWGSFIPSLMAMPRYTAAQLRTMLSEAEQYESAQARQDAELALALRQ